MMLRIGSTLALAAALLLAGLAPTRAQTTGGAVIGGGGSGYSVEGIAVQATAGNATDARTKAFAQGPRKALQQLLQQIGADPGRVSGMSDADVERMVERFQVQSEQTSPGHYAATLAYTFRTSSVQQFLGGGAPAATVGTMPGGSAQSSQGQTFAPQGHVTVMVPIAAPADWYDIQGRLTRLGSLVSSSIVSLTSRQAVLELRFPGDQSQLNQILGQQGLSVQQGAQALELRRVGG